MIKIKYLKKRLEVDHNYGFIKLAKNVQKQKNPFHHSYNSMHNLFTLLFKIHGLRLENLLHKKMLTEF